MSLHDTDALTVEAATAAESLPDPTTVNGRTHELVNTGTVSTTWSSVGATPFFEGGVAVASVTVARGESKQFQSDGTRWVAKAKGGVRAFFAGSAVSDAAGNATFAFPAGTFAAAPNVALALQSPASNQPIDFRIVTLTATSCVVNVRQSPVLVVLSLSVLGVAAPLAGVTVHALATSPGTTP